MNRLQKTRFFLILVLALTVCICCAPVTAASEPIIIDHTSTHLDEIPLDAIQDAKSSLHIAYGHTSHGSQITTGMSSLTSFAGAPYGGSTYTFNDGGTGGALDFDDGIPGASDLGNPDYTTWATATRTYLDSHPDVNVIMWSWCGQADTSAANINTYLTLMNQLETDYPDVQFVYMTGHLVGSGESGNLNQRNEQIRAYARANNKILYDFADIESYDPDGLVNYMKLNANDNCDYTLNGVSRNWATEWQASHTLNVDWYQCSAAHSQPLNGNQKAYAAWHLWARLAGWDGTITPGPVADFSASPTSGIAPLDLQFTDLSTGNGISAWAWDFNNDGTVDSTEQNPAHTYTTAGSYTVKLTVTDADGSDDATRTAYITVTTENPPPVADFSASPASGIAPLDVQFTDLSTGDGISAWAWDFNNDGTVDSTEQNPAHTYAAAGSYTVKLTVTGTNGDDETTRADYITVTTGITPTPTTTQPPTHTVPVVSAEVSGDTIVVNWQQIDDADLLGYKVVASATNPNPAYPGDGYIHWITDHTVTTATLTSQNLVPGETYYISVTAMYEPYVPVAGNAVQLTFPGGETPDLPVALPDQSGIPTDPDADGLYEDLNGSGEAGFNDVVLFFKHIDWIAENEPVAAFDFSGNGDIGFNDIVELFHEV